jgi:hypothetical protein
LRAAGCISRNIYREKVAGTRADQRALLKMLGRLASDDMTGRRIDRLALSNSNSFGIVKRIGDAAGADACGLGNV